MFLFQHDVVNIDFGYVVSLAPTLDQEIYNATYHDDIVIEVELIMSDHTLTDDTLTNDIVLSMMFGDVVVISK